MMERERGMRAKEESHIHRFRNQVTILALQQERNLSLPLLKQLMQKLS